MSLQAGIKQTGYIQLEGGKLIAKQWDGSEIGRILVGIDGLYFDGFEPIFCQQGDPAKLRLASRGGNVGGEVTFSRLRDDDKMEELVRISGERADATNNDVGQFRVSIRTGDAPGGGDYRWETVFIGTTAFLGKVWTGGASWLNWLWKFAAPGATPPENPARVSRTWSGDGLYLMQPQEDGNYVYYRLETPYNTANAVPVFDWLSLKAKLQELEVLKTRVEALEAR